MKKKKKTDAGSFEFQCNYSARKGDQI